MRGNEPVVIKNKKSEFFFNQLVFRQIVVFYREIVIYIAIINFENAHISFSDIVTDLKTVKLTIGKI